MIFFTSILIFFSLQTKAQILDPIQIIENFTSNTSVCLEPEADISSNPICSYKQACSSLPMNEGSGKLQFSSISEPIVDPILIRAIDEANNCIVSNIERLLENSENTSLINAKKEVGDISKKLEVLFQKEPSWGKWSTKFVLNADISLPVNERFKDFKKKNPEAPEAWMLLEEQLYNSSEKYSNELEDSRVRWLEKEFNFDFSATQSKEYLTKQELRIKKTFSEAKNLLLNELEERSLKYPESKKAYQKMVTQINEVNISMGTNSPKECGSSLSGGPYYSPDTKNVFFCPGANFWPDSQLFFVLVHELSHSIDPCTSIQDLNINVNEFPFLDSLKCLNSKEVLNGKIFGFQSKDENLSSKDVCGSNDHLNPERDYAPQAQEAFADLVASKLASKKFSQQETSEFMIISAAYSKDCTRLPTYLKKLNKVNESFDCPSYKNLNNKQDDPHPDSAQRLDKIFLPTMQDNTSSFCINKSKEKVCI